MECNDAIRLQRLVGDDRFEVVAVLMRHEQVELDRFLVLALGAGAGTVAEARSSRPLATSMNAGAQVASADGGLVHQVDATLVPSGEMLHWSPFGSKLGAATTVRSCPVEMVVRCAI